MKSRTVRTWIEIDRDALRHNVGEFFRIIPARTRLMAVIKSNAYGHGLVTTAQELTRMPKFAQRGWLGVDSITEALRLRREGMQNPILVLGFTLPCRIEDAAREHISISISNFDTLKALIAARNRPSIHLKIDTGMHRQGFLGSDIHKLIRMLKKNDIHPEGIFTHFASVKDQMYPTYANEQLERFNTIIAEIQRAGFPDVICHAAATAGTLLVPDAHLDMVRIGMGLYGYWPSLEAKAAHTVSQKKMLRIIKKKPIMLKPVLMWKTVVAETKRIPSGSYIGYDLTERTSRNTIIAVLPIGYWHGYDRGLSSTGQMLVRGAIARVLGRVSMDMIVIDVTDIPRVRVGDEITIIGIQGKETISAEDISRMISTSPYEFLTRINPLIKRIVV